MKLKYIIGTLTAFFVMTCSSHHQVIAKDGTVYEVKGNSIQQDGEDITDQLSREKKNEINELVNAKIKTEDERERELRKLRDRQKDLEKIEKEAERKRETLEEKQAELKKEQERRKRVKEDYLDAKEELQKQTKKYRKLQKKGKLDERDEQKWKRKLNKLEAKADEAKRDWDKLNNG